ncbi:MAG: ZIP family metal transporter [Candidatus Melainabacteria bacterium]|nr:ZIP family metal transporter [Candidatus Melainabacteria bacterium]
MTLAYAVLAALAVSCVSLLGVFTFLGNESINKRVMHLLVALAAGAMLGNALLHLVPHSLSLESEWLKNNPGFVEIFHGHSDEAEHDHDGHAHAADPHDHDHAVKHDHDHAHDGHAHAADPHDHDHAVKHDHDHAHDGHAHAADPHDHDHAVKHDHAHGGHSHTGLLSIFLVLAGFLGFLALHSTMLKMSRSSETSRLTEGWLVAFGDGVENFLDGMVIGAAFLVSVPVGIAATLTIFIHEIPLEAGDFAVIRHAGFSRAKALLLNFLSGLLSVAGAVIAVIVGMAIPELAFFATPIAAGAFLYIAGSILIPHVRDIGKSDGRTFQYFAVTLAGIALMALILLLE